MLAPVPDGNVPTTSISTWNVQGARAGTPKAEELLLRLFEQSPDVVCLTESDEALLSGHGFPICSNPDYGYQAPVWRRKVVLWSLNPWREVDAVGDGTLPSGRFVSGLTETALGTIRFTGVCIPWKDAHVNSGRRDRRQWEDHEQYLTGLQRFLEHVTGPHVILGDFNQTLPRTRAPERVHRQLRSLFAGGYHSATEGPVPGQERLLIDHIWHSPDLQSRNLRILPRDWKDGRLLSDHVGIVLDLSTSSP